MDKVLLNTENYQVRAFLRGLWQKIQRYGKMLAAVTRHIAKILSACSFSITQHVAQAYTHRKNHSLHTFDYVVFQHCKTISHNPLVPCSTHGGGTIKINDLADFFKNTPRLHTSYTLLRIFCLLAGLRRCPPSALTLCCLYVAKT